MALTYVGSVNGKAYFSDNTEKRNWTTASEFCKSANLKLATKETEEQFNFLRDNIGSPNITYFWLAGRESRRLSSFVWNETETTLDANAVKEFGSNYVNDMAYQLCLMIGSKEKPRPYQSVEMINCSYMLRGTLCQT